MYNKNEPVRTCVGCRVKDYRRFLLRTVLCRCAYDDFCDFSGNVFAVDVVPDPLRVCLGRGAWLHMEASCVEQAQRRQAFSRAFRWKGSLRLEMVYNYVSQL